MRPVRLSFDPRRQQTHAELVAAARKYLEYRGYLVVLTHDERHRPAEPGVTDLIALRYGSDELLLEIKSAGDELRPDQVKFAERAERAGLRVVKMRTLDDLTQVMHGG